MSFDILKQCDTFVIYKIQFVKVAIKSHFKVVQKDYQTRMVVRRTGYKSASLCQHDESVRK